MSDLNQIGEELFNKIRGRFPSVTIGNEAGEITNEPTEARHFNFKYQSQGQQLGEVSISIDADEGLTIIYSKDFIENQDDQTKTEWYNFLKEMRQFAKKRLLQFDVRDITKSNLNKRDYQFLSQRSGDSNMTESKMYGTNKTSYQRIGNARLAIKHSAPINTESSAGRTQKIGSIFIESPDGEKFRYPYRHLSGARAMARHVAEGGNAYDDFGKYISSLSEELSKLRKFNTYMNRSGVMAETLGEYTGVVKERAVTIRKEIQNLQKENYYRETVEGFSTPIVEEVPEDVAENWIDQLTIKQFNEELKDVFPYIYRLVGEATKAKELGPEDLEEDNDPCWKNYKMVGTKKKGGKTVPNCVPEEIELEAAFEAMMGQFGEEEPNDNDTMDVKMTPQGMSKADIAPEKPKTPLGEFILSYFDRETGKFPKGETAVLTAVEKDYGDEYVEPARQFIEQVEATTLEYLQREASQSRYPETEMIKRLGKSGLEENFTSPVKHYEEVYEMDYVHEDGRPNLKNTPKIFTPQEHKIHTDNFVAMARKQGFQAHVHTYNGRESPIEGQVNYATIHISHEDPDETNDFINEHQYDSSVQPIDIDRDHKLKNTDGESFQIEMIKRLAGM
jgi:hypothetical protein